MIDTSEWPTDDPWRFPSSLYGNHKATHSWWRKVLKKVWNAQSWSAVMDTTPMIDVRNTTGDIVYETYSRGIGEPHRSRDHWFLTWAADDRPVNVETSSLEMNVKDQQLVRAGFRYLWFTIAHIGKCSELPFLFGTPDFKETQQAIFHSVVEAICFWLPEIASLGGRLTTAGFKPSFRFSPRGIPHWLIGVRNSFNFAGFLLPLMVPEWDQFYDRHKGDPIAFLLLLNVIEKGGERYRPSTALPMRPLGA